MDATNLTITLFILGCAVPFAAEAIKVTGRLRWTLGGVAAAFVAAAVLWLPIAHNFPRVAAFVGPIASNPMSWFLLLFSGVAIAREWWSRSKQAGKPLKAPEGLAELVGATEPDLRRDLDLFVMRLGTVDDLASGAVELLARTSQKLDAVSGVADLSSEKADAAQSTADAAINKSIEQGGAIEALEATVGKMTPFVDGLSSRVTKQGSDVDALVRTVDRLLRAQFAQKEKLALDLLEEEIAKADGLLYFEDGKGIEVNDWKAWERIESHWRSTVNLWTTHARHFAEGDLMEQIKSTPQEHFYGTWSFNDTDLPNADTIHRYKAFCIMRRNFAALKGVVDQAIFHAAYC